MLKKAYSVIEIKAVDEERRTITGWATTPTVDRMGDIVDPAGVKVAADIPLFLFHDSREIVGRAKLGKAQSKGIPFEASIPRIAEAGRLKERLDEAWQMLKYRLITAVSIGFSVLNENYEMIKDGGIKYLETEVLELSLVPIPANPQAVITGIKSFDQNLRAALGREKDFVDRQDPPGASGIRKAASSGNPSNRSPKGKIMKTLKELREQRTTKAARLQELAELFKADGHEASDDETEEFDGLNAELKALDMDIRVASFHAQNASAAKNVEGGSREAGTQSRGMSFVRKQDKDEAFKGQNFVRQVIARAIATKTMGNPVDIAKHRWGRDNPMLIKLMEIKAAVPGGGSGSGEWGAELTDADTRYTADFIEFLYAMTVYDRLGLRSVPDNIQVKGQDGASTAFWVGESKGIPVTTADFMNIDLRSMKVAAIAVMSNELIMRSDPAAELLVADSIREAAAQRIDTTFLSATAASAGVSPAGILNGVTPTAWATGTDGAAVRAMIKALYAGFITAKNSSNLTLVMNPSTAKAIGLIVNALGQTEFPGLGTQGGTLLGDRVITGDNVDPSDVILLKPSDIWKIGDTGVQVDMSRDAMIEQDSAPAGATDTPVAATATFTSMFQEDSTALRVIRRTNFQKRRESAVAWVNNADFDGIVS